MTEDRVREIIRDCIAITDARIRAIVREELREQVGLEPVARQVREAIDRARKRVF